jgi:hypothetical protein
MSRTLALFLLGLALPMLATGLIPPLPAALAATAVLAAAAMTGLATGAVRGLRSWRSDRAVRASLSAQPGGVDIYARLLGDYPLYVMEAAQELGDRRNPAAAPVLLLALERLIAYKPPGWREMARAIASATEQIGDPRVLPVLRRLQSTEGTEEIDGLDGMIAGLESRAGLLRPTHDTDHSAPLLRPARSQPAREESLLREATIEWQDGPS